MDYVLIAAAAVIGLLVGYMITMRRARVAVAEELTKAQRRAAQATKTARAEVAAELEHKDHSITSLEARMDEERQKAEQARSRLQADLTHLQEERARLQARTQELSQHVDEMHGEMRQTNDESMRELEELHEIANSFAQAIERMEARLLATDRRVKGSVKESVTAPVAAPKA